MHRKGKDSEKIKGTKNSPEGLEPTAFVTFQITSSKTIPLDKLGKRLNFVFKSSISTYVWDPLKKQE